VIRLLVVMQHLVERVRTAIKMSVTAVSVEI